MRALHQEDTIELGELFKQPNLVHLTPTWVAGHGGMVGSALLRRLEREDCTLITARYEVERQFRWAVTRDGNNRIRFIIEDV